jgi:NAD(P)H dehydrogenase (quinone)
MPKPTILVTGATGKTGAPSTLLLLKNGYPVRAFVHRQDRRSDALKSAGADIFVGSLEDPVDVREALRGVQRAYFCPPLAPGALRRATMFAESAQEENSKRWWCSVNGSLTELTSPFMPARSTFQAGSSNGPPISAL